MLAIGTDIVQISRISEVLKKQGDRFLNRILSKNERHIFEVRKQSVSFLANRYAAKEAIAKAFGTGIAKGVDFVDLEVLPNELGCPTVFLHGKAAVLLKEQGASEVKITISDEAEYAVAFAIIT